ncbi:MAG TPA: hypothetical protein VJT32_13515 [bacterium]|nr:hypothetical protein [bacterium]
MTPDKLRKALPLAVAGLVVILAVLVYKDFGGKVPGPGTITHSTQTVSPSAPTGATPPSATRAAGSAATTGTPSPVGNPAPGRPASMAKAPPTQNPAEAIVGTGGRGRSDPFAPLASAEQPRPSPTLPPSPGVGLPLPPGFTAPGGGPGTAPPPPPPPGAGMRVAGIMGSRSRVAIIEAQGKSYIVGVGERVNDAVVVAIDPEKVVMKQNNMTFELGVGGEKSL